MSLLPVCRNPAKEDSETPWPAVLGKSLFLLVYTARSQSLLSPSLSLSLSLCTHTLLSSLCLNSSVTDRGKDPLLSQTLSELTVRQLRPQ